MTRCWPLVAALLLAAGPAAAQSLDLSSGGPIDITARGGFEWHEAQQEVIAEGDARAVRDNVTVIADRLIAHYRKKGGGAAPATPARLGDPDSGGNEVYRLEADGHVRIFTRTDEAVGDHAIYDIDQAVLVLTGNGLKLTTPTQVLTARDSLEYWSQQHMAVARGNAVAVSNDGRRISADTLVAYTVPNDQPGQTAQNQPKPPPPAGSSPGSTDDALNAGKIERVEAFGNVEARTQTDIVRGDRGVYVPDTGIARVVGHVRITHGQSQIEGPAADVNMKTGIAHVIADPSAQGPTGRVRGVIVPNSVNTAPAGSSAAPAAKPASGAPAR
jgi:lipopolysaccharide export system protein LptA